MRALVLIVLGATLAGCGAEPQASKTQEDKGSASSEFPRVGDYHIVREVTAGDTTRRYESDSHVAASTREGFEQLVAGSAESLSCHDRHSDIGGGSFSVRETCSGPSGDVAVDRHGTYSQDSIDVTYEQTVGGVTHTDTASYRLKT